MRFFRSQVQQLSRFKFFRFARGREGDLAFQALYDNLVRCFMLRDFFTRLHYDADSFDVLRFEQGSCFGVGQRFFQWSSINDLAGLCILNRHCLILHLL